MTLKNANDEDVEHVLAGRVGVTVIAFLKYDSIPCEHFKPELKPLADLLAGRAEILWVDATENPTLAKKLGVKTVPTTLIYRAGDKLATFKGPHSREALQKRILALIE